MIPFARMLKYGYVREVKIQKVDTTNTSTVVLFDNGELYGFGQNTFGVLGLGHTDIVFDMTLLSSGVSDVWCGQSDILIRKGDNFYYAGAGQILGSTNVASNIFVDCTSMFGTLNTGNIKKIQLSLGTLVLMNDNKLYACGFNNGFYGNGSFNRVQTLTQIQTDVLDVKTNRNGTAWIKKTDNKLYACGQNSSYQTGAGTSSTVATYTLISKFASVDLDNLSVADSTAFYYSGAALYGSGTKMGNGNNTSTASNFNGSVVFTLSNYVKMYSTNWGTTSPFIMGSSTANGIPDSLNFCGTNSYGAYGTGSTGTVTAFTPMSTLNSVISDFTKITQIQSNAYGTYVVADNKLYCAGYAGGGAVPGVNTGNQLSFIEVVLPI